MKDRKEWNDLTDEEIDEEIATRRDLMKQMVGWLYPSILSDEIETLLELKEDALRRTRFLLEKKTKNRPY